MQLRGMRLGLFALGLGAAASLASLLNACGDDETATVTTDAGSDGTAPVNPGNDGGSAESGPIVVSPPGPLDPTIAARAAAVIASCLSDDGVNRTLQELYLDRTTEPTRSPGVTACLGATTKACGAIADCLGVTITKDPGCDAGCVGNVLHACGDGRHYIEDCAHLGLACITGTTGRCAATGTPVCDSSTTNGTCDDGVPTGCSGGVVEHGFKCADYGATCEKTLTHGSDPSIDVMGCKGAGGKCQGTTVDGTDGLHIEGVSCDGDKLVGCLSNGLAVLDCAASGIGFRCFPAPDGGPNALAYCGTAAECTPQSPWEKVRATCDGNAIVACNGGKIENIDCLALGFTGCQNGLCTPVDL